MKKLLKMQLKLILFVLMNCFAVAVSGEEKSLNLYPDWSLNKPIELYKVVDSIAIQGPTAGCYYCSIFLLNKTGPEKKQQILGFRERKQKTVSPLSGNVKISIDKENKLGGNTCSVKIDTAKIDLKEMTLMRLALFGPKITMKPGKRYKLTITMKSDQLYFPVKFAMMGNYIPKGRIKEKTFYDFKTFKLEPLWMEYSIYLKTPENSQPGSAKTNFAPVDILGKGIFWIGHVQINEEL